MDFEDFNAQSQRFQGFSEAKALQNACENNGKCTVTKAEKKEKKENAPALYDLTSLQRDSNRILGLTAQQTLDYTQSLYEKKLLTYPRTDSRFLTEDMAEMIPDLIDEIETVFQKKVSSKVNVTQVINGKKVSDHHAIIPTRGVKKFNLEELPKGEKAVLELIATRLLEIETMVQELVKTYEVVKGAEVIMPKNYKVIGHCPHCGNEVVEREKGWFCSNRQCRFVLWKDNAFFNHIGKKLTEYIVDKLLRDGRAKLKDCKSKKTGKSYNADADLMRYSIT